MMLSTTHKTEAKPEGYACTELSLDDHTTPDLLLEAIILHGELLRRVVQAADPAVRAFHTYGVSDPAGFAAMGMVETLIHTYDLVRGLDPASTWRPPTELGAPLLDRLSPTRRPATPQKCCSTAAVACRWASRRGCRSGAGTARSATGLVLP